MNDEPRDRDSWDLMLNTTDLVELADFIEGETLESLRAATGGYVLTSWKVMDNARLTMPLAKRRMIRIRALIRAYRANPHDPLLIHSLKREGVVQ